MQITSHPVDLADECILALYQIVAETPEEDTLHPVYRLMLADVLLEKFRKSEGKEPGAIDESRMILEELMKNGSQLGTKNRLWALCNLGWCFFDRFEVSGSREDLDRSLDIMLGTVLEFSPTNPEVRSMSGALTRIKANMASA